MRSRQRVSEPWGIIKRQWYHWCKQGLTCGSSLVVLLVLLELALVDSGMSSQDNPSVISAIMYPGVWLALLILGWEADFSGLSVVVGIVLDIPIYSAVVVVVLAIMDYLKHIRE